MSVDVLLRVEQPDRLLDRLRAVVGAERDARTCRARPRFVVIMHDAVRAARSVDRGSGGVLQHVDRRDLVGIEAA